MSPSLSPHLALALVLAAPAPPEELPLDAWLERAAALETVAADFQLTSRTGSVADVHFAYAAPDRCHLRLAVDGDVRMDVWFDDAQATMHTWQADGSWVTGEIDWEGLSVAPEGWLEGLYHALPGPEAPEPGDVGPIFDLWPNGADDKVDFSLAYHRSRRSLFAFLRRLEREEPDAERLEDGWALALEDGVRLELELQLGFPRAAWLGEGEGARRALALTSLVIDGELAEGDLDPAAAPAGAQERSAELTRSFAEIVWVATRDQGLAWIARRAEEGLELDGEARAEVVAQLEGLHAAWARERLEALVERERGAFDGWLDSVVAWYDEHREEEGAADKFAQALRAGRESEVSRLAGIVEQYGARFDPEPSGEVPGLLLELEREGLARAFDAGLSEPVLAHVDERLAEFD